MKFIQKFNESKSRAIEGDINNIVLDLKDSGYKLNIFKRWATKNYTPKTYNSAAILSESQFSGGFEYFMIVATGRFNISDIDTLVEHTLEAQTCFNRLSDFGQCYYFPIIGNSENGEEDNEHYDDDGNMIEEPEYDPTLTLIQFTFHLLTNVPATRDAKNELVSLIQDYANKKGFKIDHRPRGEVGLIIAPPHKKEPANNVGAIRKLMINKSMVNPLKNAEIIKFQDDAKNIYAEIERIVSAHNSKSENKIVIHPWNIGLAQYIVGHLRVPAKLPEDKRFR